MTALPAAVAGAGIGREVELDVRPILGKGGDPFRTIIETVRGLGADEALHLVVGFEPVPLYDVMKALGRAAHVEKEGEVVHVWFYPDPAAPAPAAAAREPLQEPVQLDVRGLEPPQPMVTILEKLAALGPGAQLLVRHHRDPVLLYEKLHLRGYDARPQRRGEGDYLIHIAPAWVFEER
jgi:uncharacterized protein (DUF2249 family)